MSTYRVSFLLSVVRGSQYYLVNSHVPPDASKLPSQSNCGAKLDLMVEFSVV